MELLKNVQTVISILDEHSLKIALILLLISVLNVLFNIVILNKCTRDIQHKNNKKY